MKIADMVQVVTGVAVVAGLIAVFWELNQSHNTAKAQLISDNYAVLSDRWLAQMGETPSDVVAKSCTNPGALTPADIEVLNAFYHGLLVLPNRNRQISQVDSGLSDATEWKRWARSGFYSAFSTPYGRYWWQNIQDWYMSVNPAIAEIGRSVYKEFRNRPYNCSEYPDGYHAWLEELNIGANE